MKHLRIYEDFSENRNIRTKFNIKDIPKFAIDIRGCTNVDLMRILDYLEGFGKLRFNPQPNVKEKFIMDRDSQGRAWCWLVSFEYSDIYLSGVHTRGWFREDLMDHMITWNDFLVLGLEKSIEYMKQQVEEREMRKSAKKYNL